MLISVDVSLLDVKKEEKRKKNKFPCQKNIIPLSGQIWLLNITNRHIKWLNLSTL